MNVFKIRFHGKGCINSSGLEIEFIQRNKEYLKRMTWCEMHKSKTIKRFGKHLVPFCIAISLFLYICLSRWNIEILINMNSRPLYVVISGSRVFINFEIGTQRTSKKWILNCSTLPANQRILSSCAINDSVLLRSCVRKVF